MIPDSAHDTLQNTLGTVGGRMLLAQHLPKLEIKIIKGENPQGNSGLMKSALTDR